MIPMLGSTSSYMAILLSETVEKYVCLPKHFYEAAHRMETEPQFVDAGK